MATNRRLLIVEDDVALARTLQRSFERRGYEVLVCSCLTEVKALLLTHTPRYCVVDLKLPGESGLECIRLLHGHDSGMRIVMLTGFASIATAVQAIKLGACHYFAKPANTDDIEETFGRSVADASVRPSDRPTSIKTLEWECIHQTLLDTGFNISETARRLGMHRRTLARKLEKRHVS